jgi:hypothetical protein
MGSPGRFGLLFAAALSGALAAYAAILGTFFLSDDFCHLATIQARGATGLWWRGGTFLRPLTSLSIAADHGLWGLRPTPYHLHSVLLHGVNSALVGLVALMILGRLRGCEDDDDSRHAALLAAGLFLVAPSHAEAVAWLSGRGDVLAALFSLASLASWLRWERHRRARWLVMSVMAYATALASKESAIAMPLVIAMLAVWRGPNPNPPVATRAARLRTLLPHLVVLAAYLAVRFAVLDDPLRPPGATSPGAGTLGAIVFTHLAKSLYAYWPAWVEPLRTALGRGDPVALLVLATVTIATAAFVLRVLLRNRRRLGPSALAATAWRLAMLPVITLPTRLFTAESDRFLYLPSAFAVIALAWLVIVVAPAPRARLAVGSVLLLAYAAALQRANLDWRWAGATSRRIVDQAVAAPSGTDLVAVCVPDNLRGAYLFRNGFAEAVALFAPAGRTGRAWALTTVELRDRSDRIEVVEPGETLEFRSNRASVQLARTGWSPPACALLTPPTARSTAFRLSHTCGESVRFCVYRDGGLVPIQ